MNEEQLVQHLLEIEERASAVVEEAQAESDKRLLEAEVNAKAEFERLLKERLQEAQTSYAEKSAALKTAQKKEIDAYRGSLSSLKVNHEAFNSMASGLFAASPRPGDAA